MGGLVGLSLFQASHLFGILVRLLHHCYQITWKNNLKEKGWLTVTVSEGLAHGCLTPCTCAEHHSIGSMWWRAFFPSLWQGTEKVESDKKGHRNVTPKCSLPVTYVLSQVLPPSISRTSPKWCQCLGASAPTHELGRTFHIHTIPYGDKTVSHTVWIIWYWD